MSGISRIQCPVLRDRVMTAEEAAELIPNGATVGMSGFTGAGYPKAIPGALAKRIGKINETGGRFRINVWTGASTAPELDGALAEVDGIEMRLPFQTDPICRNRINDGRMDYVDYHLSEVSQYAWSGFLGKMNLAVIEVAGIREDGSLIPSSSIGNNKTWIEQADKILLEVNSAQNIRMEGMHDVYYGTALPPNRKPIMLTNPSDRIGEQYLHCPIDKVIGVVETNAPDRNSPFKAPDDVSKKIAGHIMDFFDREIEAGRLPKELLPIQSGVGNIPNAVLEGLDEGPYKNLTSYTEVIQDGMLKMLKSGTLSIASATAFSLSPDGIKEFDENIELYRDKIILRQQDLSNHPEVIRRLGIIAMNGLLEADIYGNVNSTHLMGTRMMNGIGGSGDFARNGYLSIFVTPSLAKDGAISAIVPMVSHVDHTEHDVKIIVTEQGLADLRGLSPRKRAKVIIENCAHPDYRDELMSYFERACNSGRGMHTPHLLDEALSWHQRFEETGTMKKS
ncbi:MAG: propionyl-CoA--succinate CoA transferase [Oceanospirillaceae bacterium]|uniref:acetyl-CoA hydrolase/transferase family protein n=1 Tax=unclassified Thalassolituus TaxID=2624967 RepID=UPI000C37AB81|nr:MULTISPECIES: acetyl-CoA hydrolase/transferase family protein [unclassified Thalassolituus]MBL34765.1 propionyl-CoA--succinate CoA transferase [Oceanospirillaceae bacterium]MBS52839.1 propionyl-CoA--succinate CoA transferase [Oceanospirillaceae bacterium]